jgi:hypothetical protein
MSRILFHLFVERCLCFFVFIEQLSSSLTGIFRAGTDVLDVQNRWSRIQGARSCGRWAVGSTRTVEQPKQSSSVVIGSVPSAVPPRLQRQVSYDKQVGEVVDNGMLGVEIDVQIGQMTLRSKHLSARKYIIVITYFQPLVCYFLFPFLLS